MSTPTTEQGSPAGRDTSDHLGWKPGWLHQRDGQAGWQVRPTRLQFLHWDSFPRWHPDKQLVVPYGVAQMDSGQIILVGTVGNRPADERVVVAFSEDRGDTWTPLRKIGDGVRGRPLNLTDLGNGHLMFYADDKVEPTRYFSADYGRTWLERAIPSGLNDAQPIPTEGNLLVDRDASDAVTRIGAFRLIEPLPADHPAEGATGGIEWSDDGGRTWSEPMLPPQWQWGERFEGKTYRRGTLEGALVRAANGWIVGAFRTDCHPRFLTGNDDNHCGIGVSISKDDGATWSQVRILYEAGRQHTHLLCANDGALILTFASRMDIQQGELVSYRRGCGALLSYDNGLTWDLQRECLIHSFDYSDGTPLGYSCGHAYSTVLNDRSILTCYGDLPTWGACLIRWQPDLLARS